METKEKSKELVKKYGNDLAFIISSEILEAVSMCYSDEWVINYWKEVKKETLSEKLKQLMYTKEDLETAWKSSEQNMRFQFSSSAYKGILFDQWYNSFKDIKNE